MHELSIVMSIVDIAQSQAQQAHAQAIEEIELDIGNLAGVELDALEFAWPQGVKNTMLENAVKKSTALKGWPVAATATISSRLKTITMPALNVADI